ncbi:MAG: NADPH-quinone oxidoreductase, partial [Richelia sp. SM2_1_7]|nr:NADPH-quinone oxidoreductase [Richelia sp. SM2_1_7]
LLWLGPYIMDMGAQTPFFYTLRDREMILDLFEAATGYRMVNNNYFRIGGVAVDLPYGWVSKCQEFCDYFLPKIDEYERLITNNPIFRRRVEGIGILSREDAINWGISGPMLRASGVKWDLRKVDHYECYDDFDWEVKWDTSGDCLARYVVRVGEMRESVSIIKQAIQGLPGGAYENLEAKRMEAAKKSEWNDFDYQYIAKKVAPTFKIPQGEHYVRIESGRGELGIYLIGDDHIFPWRWKIRPADFNNLQVLPQLIKGVKVADIFVILGSIDVVMGSVDR